MKTSTDLILDAIEAITKAGGSARSLMDMSLSEAIVTLHKNGLHLTLVDVNKNPQDAGWISNIGRSDNDHPESLRSNTILEIKYRCGRLAVGYANSWRSAWREADGNQYDIIAYRILKDQNVPNQS